MFPPSHPSPALRNCLRVGALALLLGLLLPALLGPRRALAQGVPLMPLAALRPGMTGYGLTVFSGTQPERFPIRVIGVLRQHLPQMDIVLIQSEDPRLLHTGIAAGMSGSPIYVDGKLVGALAYGWLFAKDAIAGVTPIEYMLKELRRPSRPPPASPSGQGGDGAGPTQASHSPTSDRDRFVAELPDRRLLQAVLGEHNRQSSDGAALGPLLPPRPGSLGADAGASRLVRAALPLSVAGFSERAVDELRQALSPYGLTPVQASGGGARDPNRRGPERFEPGGTLAIELIRGDVTAAGTGTVTYVEGNKLAAFGHQMLNAGDVLLPIATAEIFTVLASVASSFKMSSPLTERGALVQDRQSCVTGDMALRAPIVPLDVTIRTTAAGLVAGPLGGQVSRGPATEKSYHTELASHRILTPLMAQSVIGSLVQSGAPDIADAVVEVQSRLRLQGFPALEQTDYYYSPMGLLDKMVNGSTGMKQLQDLLLNPFAPVRIEGLELRIAVNYRPDVAEIIGIALPGDELEPDTRPNLLVTVRPYAGTPQVRAIPFDVPRWLAGQTLKIEASAGQLVKPEVAPPDNLNDLVENLRKGYSARSLVVTLSTADEGVMLRGRLLPNLPASVVATLRPSGASRRGEPYKRVSRLTVDLGTVLSGKQELSVLVRDDIR